MLLTGSFVQTWRHIKVCSVDETTYLDIILYNLEERVVSDKNLILWSTCRYLLWFSPPAGRRRWFSATLFLHSTGMTSLSAERSKVSFRNKTEQLLSKKNKSGICYLENVVLDVTDLDLLVGASVRSVRGQQRLESKKNNNKLAKRLLKWLMSLKWLWMSSRPASTCLRSPVRSCDQKDSVAVKRFPLHHKCHIWHLLVVQEMRVCRKNTSAVYNFHSQDSFLETRRPEVWTLVHHYNITCSGSLTSESLSKVSRARKCFHETDIW